MKLSKPLLLIEDDDVDARSIQRACAELHITNPLARVTNGEEALAWLQDPANPRPCLLLLDLNLPVMNGIEFLEAVKGNDELRRLPVVVLTSSRLEADKLASFNLSVAGYMVKPVDYAQLVEVVRAIDVYWTLSETP